MATSTFSAKITDLVGGTIDDNACDDWMTEGAKEISRRWRSWPE